MACAWLVACAAAAPAAVAPTADLPPAPPLPRSLAATVDARAWAAVARMAASGFAAPLTTSMGRLFDAVAALCGLRARCSYEGQAAIELEAAADRTERGAYPLPLTADGRLDARATVAAVLADLRAGATTGAVSTRFHRAVAQATAAACARAAADAGCELVVLSGGVFQNRLLLELTRPLVSANGLRVLVPERLPPGDGGIAFGQAAVASASDAGGD